MLYDSMSAAGTGAVFGAALTASGVHLPSVIIDQFRLADFHMFHVFATAMGSSAIIMVILDKTGVVKRPVRPNSTMGLFSQYDANLAGGALVGVGMALSGACPGTVLVQLAQGIPSAKAAASGSLLGAAIYIWFQEQRKKSQLRSGTHPIACTKTISDMSKVPEVAIYTLLGASIAAVLRLTQAGRNQSLVPPVLGGLLIGCAQAVSLLVTRSPLGVSTAYEHLSGHMLNAFRGDAEARPSLPTKSIIFALGIVGGSMALLISNPSIGSSTFEPVIPAWQAFAGGVVLTFGARLGGGCTSGHGLSGLSAMSASSLVTVAAMFGAGILISAFMG